MTVTPSGPLLVIAPYVTKLRDSVCVTPQRISAAGAVTCAEKTVGITQLACVKVNTSILSKNCVEFKGAV